MKNNKIKMAIAAVLAALCVVFAIFAVRGFSGGKTSPNDAKHGVVYIEQFAQDASGNTALTSGTGFMIGKQGENPQYLVTNAHVVNYYYAFTKGQLSRSVLSVYFSAVENDYVSPQIVYYSEPNEKDIAILKLPSPTDKRAPLLLADSDKVTPGDEVYAIGYPGISTQSQDYIRYDEDDATLTKGVISKLRTSTIVDGDMFETDAVINHGNSGGPLVDKGGHVIGINESISQETVAGVDENGNLVPTYISNDLGYAITSKELTKVLDAEKIPYAMAGGGSNGILFLILAIACLACALFFLMKARKAPAAGPGRPRQAAGEAPPAGKRPILKGVTGQYAGQSFQLSGGPLTIGRDGTSCNVVFNKDTPGVSGKHCTLAYDQAQGGFILTDVGSSYGTFLGNDQKLAANVPERLQAGDSFYLAYRSNSFVVSLE